MHSHPRLIGLVLLVAMVALSSSLPSAAQGAVAQLPEMRVSPIPQDGPTDPAELEAFLDDFFVEQMEVSHLPGAVFVLVKD